MNPKTLLLSLLSSIILIILPVPLFAQQNSNDLPNIFTSRNDQLIWVDAKAWEEFNKGEVSTTPSQILEPGVTTVNFDDMPWNGNAWPISPYRYPGVSFYSPASDSQTFTIGGPGQSVSFPNRLIVGANVGGFVQARTPLAIDFTQNMQDVSFYLGTSGCSIAYVDVYHEGYFIQRRTISFGGFDWVHTNLNDISRKITNVRIHFGCTWNPPNWPVLTIDNVTFQPNPFRSPIGWLDSVSVTNPVGARGWSIDPDNESASNYVDCYVDGRQEGEAAL